LIYIVNLLPCNFMNLNKLRILTCVFLLLPSFLILNFRAYPDNSSLHFLFELEFGMSSKNAIKLIAGSNREILKNEVDSKEVRTISFNGGIVEYPSISDVKEVNKRTKLEFYDDRLMSTSLVVGKLDMVRLAKVRNEFSQSIETDFGGSTSKDRIGFYDIWTWKKQNLKIILSTNRSEGEIKLKYIYTPIADYKVEKELNVKRKGKFKHPADQMFKDGNYSQQSGPQTGRSNFVP